MAIDSSKDAPTWCLIRCRKGSGLSETMARLRRLHGSWLAGVLPLIVAFTGCSKDETPIPAPPSWKHFTPEERALAEEIVAESPGVEIRFNPPPPRPPVRPEQPGNSAATAADGLGPPPVTKGHITIIIGASADPADSLAESLVEIDQMQRVGEVHIDSDKITDDDLAFLAETTKVMWLNLAGQNISDETMQAVGNLVNLHELEISRTAITDAGVGALGRLQKLGTLRVHGLAITGSGFENLSELEELRFVSLQGSAIDDDGLAGIAKLPGVVSLNLTGTKITDDGLKHFAKMKTLRYVNAEQTKVTARGVNRLKRQRPKLRIDVDAARKKR